MDTTSFGFPVFADRHAWESDGIVVVNRVKPHSDLSGGIESGMLKMMAIGLGKREGATETHKQIWKHGLRTHHSRRRREDIGERKGSARGRDRRE